LIRRHKTKQISIGSVTVGGDSPIVVQTMTKTDTRNVKTTVHQIKELADHGCQIVRLAVPDMEAADALKDIRRQSPVPLVADIHFDHRLALAALKAGIDGLRINPGNIRDPEHVKKIVTAASERNIPIRIGINAGSLPPAVRKYTSTASHMVAAAMSEIKLLEDLNFTLIKISLKAFNVLTTVEAYRSIAKKIPYPLHVGITESGVPRTGIIRSSVGIGILLNEGIGDTIRVSLSADPVQEVETAYEILKSLDLREHGPVMVSCPTCGRCEADTLQLAESIDTYLKTINSKITVAVMGCVVNGPGEAREADVGIACGKGKGVIFKKGSVIRTVPEREFETALKAEIKSLLL
jgi:(E)-4-hydroxy-3-methylbut-2-enyl-diphosphate synthase